MFSVHSPVQPPTDAQPAPLIEQPPDQWYQTHAGYSRPVAFFLWHGLASSTRRTYSTGQRSFLDFLRLHPALANSDGNILPASQKAILEWVVNLAGRFQPKTIKAYLSAVRSLHTDAGHAFEPIESPVTQRVLRGIKRVYGERERRAKLPITIDILRRIVALPRPADSFSLTILAAYRTAFAGFLRTGEFTVRPAHVEPAMVLTRGMVTFLPSLADAQSARLTLPASKTDP